MPPLLPSKPTKDVTKISAAWLSQLLVCLDYAMTHPGADGQTLKDNSGSLSVIRPYHNTGSSGTVDAAAYKGVFAIVAGENDTFKCVNNALPVNAQNTSPAGIAYIGYLTISVAALLNIPANNYVWLETSYSEENSTYTTILNSGAEVPEGSQGFNVFYVGFAGDSIDQSLKENYDARWLLL